MTPYSVAWIVLSAVVGLLAGAVSSWITYQFRKGEIVATVRGDIEKQRRTQALAQEKERVDRIRNEINQWANPILGAVDLLAYRLNNILSHDGYVAGKCPEISTVFALKHAHLPRIMHIETKFPGQIALYLGYQSEML